VDVHGGRTPRPAAKSVRAAGTPAGAAALQGTGVVVLLHMPTHCSSPTLPTHCSSPIAHAYTGTRQQLAETPERSPSGPGTASSSPQLTGTTGHGTGVPHHAAAATMTTTGDSSSSHRGRPGRSRRSTASQTSGEAPHLVLNLSSGSSTDHPTGHTMSPTSESLVSTGHHWWPVWQTSTVGHQHSKMDFSRAHERSVGSSRVVAVAEVVVATTGASPSAKAAEVAIVTHLGSEGRGWSTDDRAAESPCGLHVWLLGSVGQSRDIKGAYRRMKNKIHTRPLQPL